MITHCSYLESLVLCWSRDFSSFLISSRAPLFRLAAGERKEADTRTHRRMNGLTDAKEVLVNFYQSEKKSGRFDGWDIYYCCYIASKREVGFFTFLAARARAAVYHSNVRRYVYAREGFEKYSVAVVDPADDRESLVWKWYFDVFSSSSYIFVFISIFPAKHKDEQNISVVFKKSPESLQVGNFVAMFQQFINYNQNKRYWTELN